MSGAYEVSKLVQLNGGLLIGKTRLQKSAYFLEAKGVGLGFDFSYFRFGPYSEELASSVDDAEALGLLEISWRSSQAGASYAVYACKHNSENDTKDVFRRRLLEILKKCSAVEVELAATADFLRRDGFGGDAWVETRRRKAAKAEGARLARSQQLLKELDQQ